MTAGGSGGSCGSMTRTTRAAGLALIGLGVGACLGLLARGALAASEGLWWQTKTRADQVTVRRFEDSERNVVCYVAHGDVVGTSYNSSGPTVAISCLQR